MAKIKSIAVRDFTGAANVGVIGETASVTITLDEVLTATNGTVNGNSVIPTFVAGTRTLDASFVTYNQTAKTITYNIALPSGISGTQITLSSLSLNNITLLGAKNAVFSTSGLPMTANYTIDTIAPTFTSLTSNSATVTENSAPSVIFTATAGDNSNSVSYRLTGADASFFNIDRAGLIRLRAAADFETKSTYAFNVVATDRVGNATTQALTVNVDNVDEAVILRRGVTGVGSITVAKGNLSAQAKSILADFVNDTTSGQALSFTVVGGNSAISVVDGQLRGTLNSATTSRITLTSNDNVLQKVNGKAINDASRVYNLVVLDKPAVASVRVSDSTDVSTTGKVGQVVNIQVLLTEALTGANPTGVTATFVAGRNPLTGLTYTGTSRVNEVTSLNFTGTLPAGDSSSIALTSINFGTNRLLGLYSNGVLTSSLSKLNVQATYLLDNTAPRITSGAAVTINENATGAIYTASATDVNTVRYSINGAGASLFDMNTNTGVLTVKANTAINYEGLRSQNFRVSLNVIATDSNGNTSTRPIVVAVRDVDEATQFRSNTTPMANNTETLSAFTLYKDVGVNNYTNRFDSSVFDPEGRTLTYRISDGWLPNGLTLNSRTGAITGKPTNAIAGSAYNFTITADDGVLNGNDASRKYQGTFSDNNLLRINDPVLAKNDTEVALTLYGSFASAGTVQLFKRDDSTTTAVGTAMTITSASEIYEMPVDKTNLSLNNNSNANYFIRYISPDSTPVTTNSIDINISRDDTAPVIFGPITISGSDGRAGYFNAGDVITASITYNEVINITGSPTLTFAIGTNNAVALFSSISSASIANFTYTIAEGDTDVDGISIPAGAFTDVTIADAAGNTASLAYNGLSNQANYIVDTTAPTGTPVISFTDTGTSPTDGITANPNITVSGLDTNESWEYRVNGTGLWLRGRGTSFQASIGNNSYQVRQVDAAGNSTVSESKSINLRSLAQGFVLNGDTTIYTNFFSIALVNDRTGAAVSNIADINGDGLSDLIVPAAFASQGRSISYVIFGKSGPSPVSYCDISQGTGGFAILGHVVGEGTATILGSAGDVNGDGINDILIGAPSARANGLAAAGRFYVVFGKTDTQQVNLANIVAGSGGFVINGEYASIAITAGSSLGDINNDGLADIIIGYSSVYPGGNNYVIYGKTTTTAVDLSNINNGAGGFVIEGEFELDNSGISLSDAGDINGDGRPDWIICANTADPNGVNLAGRMYVVFGQTAYSRLNLTTVAAGTGGFAINGYVAGEYAGDSVAGAGDINGDGLADVIIGASQSSPATGTNAGKAYVVFGKTDTNLVELSSLAGGSSTKGFIINGEAWTDFAGRSIAAAGDVNGDGMADVIIGAHQADNNGLSNVGRSYVVFGTTSGAEINLSTITNGTGGFVINGYEVNGVSGISVSGAGDVNADGLADLIVGMPFTSGVSNYGRAFVVFGKSNTAPVNLADIALGQGEVLPFSNIPTTGNDTFNGNTTNQIILGDAGNDTLSGGGGTDVLLGGAGDDVLVINASNIAALQAGVLATPDPAGFDYYRLARVDGGSGIDTLRLTGGANLNLTNISQIAAGNIKLASRISSIERIDLATDTAANTLTLKLEDVVDMAGMNLFNSDNGWTGLTALMARHQLVINGGAGDSVDIADGTGTANWTSGATVTNGGISYVIWNHNTAAAQLLVQQGVGVI